MSDAQGEEGRRGRRTLVPGTPVDGRFRIVRVLGRWGIGTAYLVTDAATGEERALFALLLAAGREAAYRDWVRGELARARAVSDDGLLTALAGGGTGDLGGYLVVRRPRGVALPQHLKKHGPLPGPRAVALVEALARIVRKAHEAGLFLGDLRPSTVLLEPGDDPRPAILDLGLARGLAEYLDRPPSPAAAFCSPARRAGEPPAPADDVYGLGALLFYVSTGVAPAPDPGGGRRVPTPPSWVRPDLGVSPYIDPVVLRAMAPRPEDRFASIADLLDALAGVRELFALPPAARELLGMPTSPDTAGFSWEATSPHLLHEMLGVPQSPFETADQKTIELDPDELEPGDDG